MDEGGRGVENVLLNAGRSAAIADKKGGFLFPSLKPEITYLQIDRASMGLDRVTFQPMPMEIVVRGGEESVVEINVIRSSTISGNAALFGQKEQAQTDGGVQFVELHGQANVFIELSNGNETLRRVADSRGRFTFTDLRPGRWVLKAVGGEVPLYHGFEKEFFEFDLKPGAHENATFKILPRRRQIKIIQEGRVIQETKPESPKFVSPQSAGEQCIVVYDRAKGYLIQLSSWQTQVKAQQLAVHAKASFPSFESFVQTADIPKMGRRHRVRIGVFKTRKEAVELCERHRQSHQ